MIGDSEIAESQPAGIEIAVGPGWICRATGVQRPGQEQTAAGLLLSPLI